MHQDAKPSGSELLITLTKRQATESLVLRLARQGAAGVRLIAKGFRPAEYRARYDTLLQAGRSVRKDFRIIVDLPGGKPRISSAADDFEVLRDERLLLCGEDDQSAASDVRAVGTVGLMSYLLDFEIGDRVLVSDGAILLRVLNFGPEVGGVLVRVESPGGGVTASRSINLPDTIRRQPRLHYASRGDDDGVLVAFERDSDVEVAVSMVAVAQDVERVRNMLPDARVLAKIESQGGVDNVTRIARAADELIVARADLSIEIGPEKVGAATETILRAAEDAGRPAMVAAGFLESLEHSDRPRIAEATDLWYQHRLGVRRFLLSGDVCVQRPLEAVSVARSYLDSWDERDADPTDDSRSGRSARDRS